MNKLIKNIKSLFCKDKKECLSKKALKKTAFVLDMKRRNKFITFFALFFIAAYFCMPSMESIVKNIVHKYGSELTGTNVNLKGFDVKLSTGEGRVNGITVANPKGYKSKNLFSLNEISVKLNIGSITKDTIIIENIMIDNPVITYEMLSLTQNNISDILENIRQNTQKTEQDEKQKTAKSDKQSQESKNIVVKKLTLQNGQIEVMAGMGDLKKSIMVPLPTIELKDIGQNKKGASITETLSTILQKVLNTVLQTVATSGLKDFGNQAVDQLKNTGDAAIEAGKNTLKDLKAIFE